MKKSTRFYALMLLALSALTLTGIALFPISNSEAASGAAQPGPTDQLETIYAAVIQLLAQTATAQAATATAGYDATVQAALVQAVLATWQAQHPSSNVTHNADWAPVLQTFDGVDMALVPAGCFDMGSTNGNGDEQPVNQQCFNTPFWIDRTEVTNGQFASLHGQAKGSSQWTEANRPRESITWTEASAFCALRGAWLPTEAEWEYAARGPDDWVYPWGNDFVADNVVYSGNSGNQTADVGSRPAGASWVGTQDMAGNVWEWVSSAYEVYPYDTGDGREDMNRTDVSRVVRGGAWNYTLAEVRASDRGWGPPTALSNSLGVRCARSFEE